MHGIANPKNREFKSHPLLQVKSIQPFDGLVPGMFFTTLAQLNRALGYELRGREFESLRWCQFSSCSSKVEHTADNRETLDRYHPRGPQLTTNLKCCIIDFLHRSTA